MKIVFLDRKTLGDINVEAKLEKLGDDIQIYASTKIEEVIDRCKDAEIILTNKVVINRAVMDQCPKLRLICITATGMNNVDLEYASQKNIQVKNVSNYSTNSVAQLTLSFSLHFLSSVSYYNDYVKSGAYSENNLFTHLAMPIEELSEKIIGIIGLGAIGRKVADLYSAFGAKVYYYSTSGESRSAIYERLEFDELLACSDIITIHAPLNDKTANLITKKELKKMKKTAILLNTGRGGIINENDLADALLHNEIGAAAIDVFSQEPFERNHKLLSIKSNRKLLLTPHIAWATATSRNQLMDGVVKNIEEFKSTFPV